MFKIKIFTFDQNTAKEVIEEQINGWLAGVGMIEAVQITALDPCRVLVCYKLREMKGYI